MGVRTYLKPIKRQSSQKLGYISDLEVKHIFFYVLDSLALIIIWKKRIISIYEK